MNPRSSPCFIIAGLTLCFVIHPLSTKGATADESEPFLNNGITAHRGDSGTLPENTLAAFASAIQCGADWIELDLFRTADNQLIVIHDKTTARTGDRNLSVPHSNCETLQEIDIATGFRKTNNLSKKDCPPRYAPKLEDVLSLVMKQTKTRVSIQPKMDCVMDAIKVIRRLNAMPWIGFNDGNLGLMIKAKALAPEAVIFWDRGANTNLSQDIQIAVQHNFHALIFQHHGLTKEKIEQTPAAGLQAGAWTVNDPKKIEALLTMGINRIYTDYPARMKQITLDLQTLPD